MAMHNDFGDEGEELGAQWLIKNGYTILHRNWTFFEYEIDVIAKKGKFLHFIEIKSRNYTPFGHPEDSVTKKKFKSIQTAARAYLNRHPGNDWIQYDVLSVTRQKGGSFDYFFIPDVFL
jgi:putative endonuclease